MARLFIDMDDVSTPTTEYIVEQKNKGGAKLSMESLTNWDRNYHYLQDYYEKPGFFLELPPMQDAIKCLRQLSKRHDVWFLTSPPTPHSASEKMQWAETHFPFIGWQKVALAKNKGVAKGDLLYDDSPEFLPQFDGIKVLQKRPYNVHLWLDPRFIVVDGWAEFMVAINVLERTGKLPT